MASFNVKPYESNLRGGFNLSNLSNAKKSQNTTQQNKVSAKLSIDKTNQSNQTQSDDVKVITDRQRVENKISNQLLSSSTSLTIRSSINESLSDGISKLKTLAKSIKTEVDPTRKEDLIAEAESLLAELQSQYDSEVEEDPNISQDINITSLVKPGAEAIDSSKYKQVSISGLLSPDDSGLSGIDFSDADAAIDQIDNSLAAYSQKQKSYEASGSEIAGATSKALTQLNADGEVKQSEVEEEKAEELANQIASSAEKLLSQNKLDNNSVKDLLESNEEDENSDSEEDPSKKTESKGSPKLSQYSNSYQNGNSDSAILDIAA